MEAWVSYGTDHRLWFVVKHNADPDGASVEVFPLPTDEGTPEALQRDLFENAWHEITFGTDGPGGCLGNSRAARAEGDRHARRLSHEFGQSHFHLCIGPHKGSPGSPASAPAQHRRTSRAELYRRLEACTSSTVTASRN